MDEFHGRLLTTLLTTSSPTLAGVAGLLDWYWRAPHLRNDRTIYIIGLFGTGRSYFIDLIRNIGERAQFFRDGIRLHSRPTSMIYSGHATMKYVSCGQAPPAVMSSVLKATKWGYADLIFVYRHPLDSLLTNWIWWRTFIRDNILIGGISQVYKNTDDLCADLDRNFLEFEAFAEGDAKFFAAAPRAWLKRRSIQHWFSDTGFKDPQWAKGQRFLSFSEFVEETELHLQVATLRLRFEDFAIDPIKEFSKILKVASVDLDLSRRQVDPPKAKPYHYLAVRDKVPRFKNFIDGLNAETKKRIEEIGYGTSV
jgi:hypothetical protein